MYMSGVIKGIINLYYKLHSLNNNIHYIDDTYDETYSLYDKLNR